MNGASNSNLHFVYMHHFCCFLLVLVIQHFYLRKIEHHLHHTMHIQVFSFSFISIKVFFISQ